MLKSLCALLKYFQSVSLSGVEDLFIYYFFNFLFCLL